MPTPPVAVLLHDAAAVDGRPDAVDTLNEVRYLAAALGRLGYCVRTVPVDLDLARLERALRELDAELVVNLVESIAGRGQLVALVPALLESLGIAFTGCGALAQALASNKPAAKRCLQRAGLPAPLAYVAGGAEGGPWIVKSVWEHSSLGIDASSIVRESRDVAAVLATKRGEFGGEWFAERYIDGRELNIALIDAPASLEVLPISEIRFVNFPADQPKVVGYAAKWDTGSAEYRGTVREFLDDRALAERATGLARACWELFGLSGYARVDLRVDDRGEPWVLEANANPCLSPDAGFCAALAAAGIEFDRALDWLIHHARGRMMGPSSQFAAPIDVSHP
jgi:D-alanine-D-alanine ligase